MKDGTASHTARSVAAHRLEYERVAADYGDPAADQALTADVADGQQPNPGRMHEHLRARTAFFDRAVVSALGRGVRQVVIGGAGYDGRALRYAKPGVTWFELDHPATQADKVARVARLGLERGQVRFIAADFTADPIAEPLLAAGLDPARPTLFLLEGVAVYLERPVLERVLAAFRQVAADGSELAMSGSTGTATPQHAPASSSGWPRSASRSGRSSPPTRPATSSRRPAGSRPRPERQLAAGLLLPAAPGAADDAAADARPRPPRIDLRVPAPPALPLSALLSAALVAFTIEADNEAEHRLPHRTANDGPSPGAAAGAPWLTSLLMWANCLRHLPDEGITVAELRRRARTGTNLDGMRRWRYVSYAPDPGRGKRPGPGATVIPTAAGRRARAVWAAATEETEARWRERFGAAAIDDLRAALADVVARLDPALPDCLRSSATPCARHSNPKRPTAEKQPTPSRSRAPRRPDLPLWALLSRPLLAFALEYERAPGPSLAVSANVLRVIGPDGVRTRDIPALAGISKEAVAMAVGRLAESGLATEGPDPAAAGSRSPASPPRAPPPATRTTRRAAAIEADWRARFGARPGGRAPGRPGAARGRRPAPAVRRPRPLPGQLARPRSAAAVLPHYPMTLHRGGYPDGA